MGLERSRGEDRIEMQRYDASVIFVVKDYFRVDRYFCSKEGVKERSW